MSVDIHQLAHGRWAAILPALGVPTSCLRNRHGPCPVCKTEKHWFRFDDKEGSGSWICNHCGAGNGVDLVMQVNGLSFLEAKDRIAAQVGSSPYQAPAPGPDYAKLKATMQRTWDAGRPIQDGSAAAAYLSRRTGLTSFCRELRAHGRLWCREPDGVEPSFRPALLARVRDGEGKPVSVHRTYLDHDGRKADIDKPKRLMASAPLPDVCAIRLAPVAETLGVAEGIETALSAMALFGTPCWSLISTSLMQKWRPPAGVKRVIIYGDRDESYAGQQAAVILEGQLLGLKIDVDRKLPDTHGDDWNDVLMRRLAGATTPTAPASLPPLEAR